MARVLLLFGGRSAEHEVSCVSAVAIYDALVEGGHRVVPVAIDRQGAWHIADPSRRPFRAEGRPAALGVPEGMLRSGRDEVGFDVVFPVLHGPYGEDGTVQGLFEITGKPYVGCGVLPSALAMEKDVAKRLFVTAGLSTARWEIVRDDDYRDDPAGTVDRVIGSLGIPVFVKPVSLGSSVGVTRVAAANDLKEGIDEALRHGDKVIVEEAVVGREIEVAVLDGPRASYPGEVLAGDEWYTYDAKYHNEASRFETPAALPEARLAEVQSLAMRAFTTLECRGLARVDFFFEQGGRGFLVNEVNTMPGFTPISGFPKMWQASGMSYAELCNELVEIALA
jgi:D-alanine-D-alanine ligase